MSSLQDPAIAAVFRHLLWSKRIVEGVDGTEPEQINLDALAVCFLNGWAHSDLEPDGSRRVYVLPSRCHEWYISCALLPHAEAAQCSPPARPGLRAKVRAGLKQPGPAPAEWWGGPKAMQAGPGGPRCGPPGLPVAKAGTPHFVLS